MATSEITLREIKKTDLRMIYEWRVHPAIRSQMFTESVFSYEEHLKFWGQRIGNGMCFMIVADKQEVGMVKLEKRDGCFEVDIFVGPKHHGKGFGSRAIGLIKDRARGMGIKKLYSRVKEGNVISNHIFEKNGFKAEKCPAEADGNCSYYGCNLMKRILVIAAHPDDETLGCGGAMAKHVATGDSVSVLILGTGLFARNKTGELENSGEKCGVGALRNDSRKAISKLGVTEVEFLDFPDNRFDSVALLDIVKAVEKKIIEKTPDTVYTHHWGDLNIDHRKTFEAVLTACRPFAGTVKRILCFEVLSSTECAIPSSENVFMPNFFMDVSGTIDKKISALKEYKTEMRPAPHPRSVEGVEALAKFRGFSVGVRSAEAFELLREVG